MRSKIVMRNTDSMLFSTFSSGAVSKAIYPTSGDPLKQLQLFLEPEWALSQQPMRPKAEWAIDSEAMRARGIIVLVKSNYSCSQSKILRQNNFSQLKLDLNGLFCCQNASAFHYQWAITQPRSSSTNRSIDNRPPVGFYYSETSIKLTSN